VALDIPWPVDYGGVFDLFYKLKALHEAGVKVHLHCFSYEIREQPELNKYCVEVKYYQRQKGHKGFSHKIPYIVASRADKSLLDLLAQDDHPILLEGVHCTFLLNDDRFKDRKIVLRLHNVEYLYYNQLFHSSRNVLQKIYYLCESRLLKSYETDIADKAMILAVSENDMNVYRSELGASKIAYLPVFLPFEEVHGKEGIGCFCLYHGNLSVPENEAAALWLLKNVFKDLHVPFIIAGKNPSPSLEQQVQKSGQACLIANPSEQEMQDMIAKAQINILPAFNCTGIKLKLLNALYNGRHCVVNEATVKGSGLEPACHIGSTPEAMQEIIAQLYHKPFTEDEIKLRQTLLQSSYNNRQNVQRLIQWIW
jgi:hypothetical protein